MHQIEVLWSTKLNKHHGSYNYAHTKQTLVRYPFRIKTCHAYTACIVCCSENCTHTKREILLLHGFVYGVNIVG